MITIVEVEDAQHAVTALKIIHENCHERSRSQTSVSPPAEPGEFCMVCLGEVQVGGATVFVVPADLYEKI